MGPAAGAAPSGRAHAIVSRRVCRGSLLALLAASLCLGEASLRFSMFSSGRARKGSTARDVRLGESHKRNRGERDGERRPIARDLLVPHLGASHMRACVVRPMGAWLTLCTVPHCCFLCPVACCIALLCMSAWGTRHETMLHTAEHT